MPENNAEDVIIRHAHGCEWTERTQLELALRFVDEQRLLDRFDTFLQEISNTEKDMDSENTTSESETEAAVAPAESPPDADGDDLDDDEDEDDFDDDDDDKDDDPS